MSSFSINTSKVLAFILLVFALSAWPEVAPWQRQGRIAASHDGNVYNYNDWGAAAWDWAIYWAFGVETKVCHYQHSDNLGRTNKSWETQMAVSSIGGAQHFGTHMGGYGSTKVVYSFYDDPSAAVAHFKIEGDKSSLTDPIFFTCGGPMEAPYRCLVATDVTKRKFLTFISQLNGNQTFTEGIASHTWADMQAVPGNAKFIQITDQSFNLGTTCKGKWDFLTMMPASNGKTAADWQWLYSRDLKDGDVSDAGMTWYLFTGDMTAVPAKMQSRWLNPVRSNTPTTNIYPFATRFAVGENALTMVQNGSMLHILATGVHQRGVVSVCNLLDRLLYKSSLIGGSAVIPLGSMNPGTYIVNVKTPERTVTKQLLVK